MGWAGAWPTRSIAAMDVHGRGDVVEEVFAAGAQVVLAGFAVGGDGEPVFGAAAVAGGPDVAVPAVPGQGVTLVAAELPLPGKGDQLQHLSLMLPSR